MPKVFFLIPLIIISGCIGTDMVDEPLGPVPSGIQLPVRSLNILQGENFQLTAEVIASDGNPISTPLTWSSRNTNIATVSGEGLLSAVGTGQVWIDALTQTLNDSLLVTVSEDPNALASIVITGRTMELLVGDTLQLNVELKNSNGELVSVTSVNWSSQDTAVCMIDNSGLVVAASDGNTQIRAMADGITSLPYEITVGSDTASRSGTFQGLNGYNVSGTATIRPNDGVNTLFFENDFRSQNGPGLYVYLSPNSGNVSGGVSLGTLKSTSGEQTYEIPDAVDPNDFSFVLVYCQPFGVPFGRAELQ